MREILFKAKRIDDGEWVEGYYQKRYDEIGRERYYIFRCESNIVWEYAKVDANTLCQYTGLTDKNGCKIWENDIVTHTYIKYKVKPNDYPPFGTEKKQKNYVIRFDSTASFLGYRYHNSRNIFPFKKGTVINGNDEVIGNIFDNPELLHG